jgi:hypothetical protein
MNPMIFELAQDAVQLLRDMISIESFSREEKNVADFLERYIESKGYVASRSGNNIWLESGFDTAKPTILLIRISIRVKLFRAGPEIPLELNTKTGNFMDLEVTMRGKCGEFTSCIFQSDTARTKLQPDFCSLCRGRSFGEKWH